MSLVRCGKIFLPVIKCQKKKKNVNKCEQMCVLQRYSIYPGVLTDVELNLTSSLSFNIFSISLRIFDQHFVMEILLSVLLASLLKLFMLWKVPVTVCVMQNPVKKNCNWNPWKALGYFISCWYLLYWGLIVLTVGSFGKSVYELLSYRLLLFPSLL